jgi:hypothetical protein
MSYVSRSMFQTPAGTSEDINTVVAAITYNKNVSMQPQIRSDLDEQLSAILPEVDPDLTVAPSAADIANWREVIGLDDCTIPKKSPCAPDSATLWEELQKLQSQFEQLSVAFQTLQTQPQSHKTRSPQAYTEYKETAADALFERSTQLEGATVTNEEQLQSIQIRLAAVEERLEFRSEDSMRITLDTLKQEIDILKQKADMMLEQSESASVLRGSVESEVNSLSGVISSVAKRAEDLTERYLGLKNQVSVLKHDSNGKLSIELLDKFYEELKETKRRVASVATDVESRLTGVDKDICSLRESKRKLTDVAKEMEGNLEELEYAKGVHDKDIDYLQQSCTEFHSGWENMEKATEEKLAALFDEYRKMLVICAHEIQQGRTYREQVGELMDWKRETEKSGDTELIKLKQQVQALQEDSQKKDVLIEELRPLVARHDRLLETWTHTWGKEVKTSMSQIMDIMQSNTDATVKHVEQTRDLKDEMEKHMIQLHIVGQDSVKYCKTQVENLQTEQSEKLENIKDSMRTHIHNRSQEAKTECGRLVDECKAAVGEVVDALDMITGLKGFRAAKE